MQNPIRKGLVLAHVEDFTRTISRQGPFRATLKAAHNDYERETKRLGTRRYALPFTVHICACVYDAEYRHFIKITL